MKKISKQALSVLLTVIMIVTTALPAFAQSEEPQTNTQTDVSYESTNVLGDLILDNYQEQENESENAEYLITSVVIEDMTATVELKNLDACTVVVALYENNGGKMLASGKTDIEANESVKENTVSVTIDTDEMPEYFYVKAFLVDLNNAPLCKYFETNEYTKEFEEFMAKTTEDFEDDRVLNLDESEDNNFLVVSDEATVIEPEKGKNTVAKDDYENGIYVIENADEQVKNLKKDDVFYYEYGEGENDYIIIKIEDIKIDGDTVTLTASEIDEISELFQFIKIDETTTQTTFDASGMAEGVTHESMEISTMRHDVNIDTSVSAVEKWSIDIELTDNIEFGAGIEGTFGAGLKFFYDFYLFDSDYYYFELTISSSVAVSVYVSGKMDSTIPLGKVGFDFFGAVTAKADFSFIFEAEAELELSFTIAESVIGASYDNINGLVNKTTSSEAEFDNELSFEITFFAGFEIKPEVKVFKYAEMSLSAKTGLEVTITEPVSDPAFAIHDCGACLDIKVDFVASLSMKIKILEIINKSTTFASLKINMLTAYYSNDLGFGEGKCSNISYAVNITVVDKDKNPLPDVIINDKYQTDSNGKELIYLPTGKHTIALQHINGNTKTQDITIVDNSMNVTISIDIRKIVANNHCGGTIEWNLYDDGELFIYQNGDYGYDDEMWDINYKRPQPWANYRNLIKSVTISTGVSAIGGGAFQGCVNLRDVTISESVKSIRADAFAGCTSLTNIIIPDSVNEIALSAFDNCINLSNLTIPDSVTNIIIRSDSDELPFESINVNENNTNYSSDEYGVLFNKDKSVLKLYPICNSRTDYKIPDSVTTIQKYAFQGCDSLENIIIPEGVTVVDDFVFFECTNLTSIIIPDNVTTIGRSAFARTALESITIPNSVKMIGDYAFSSCNNLTTVYYTGTQKQWDELAISSTGNDVLKNANIICSDTVSTASVMSLLPDNKLSAYLAINIQSETLTDAVSGYDYVMIAVRDENAEDLLAPSNLLYIDQQTAESEDFAFEYVIDESITDYDVLVFGQKLPHYHIYDVAKTAPTCTEQGYTTYTCECGDSYADDYVEAKGHTDEVIPGYAATCTETGLTDGVKCSVCGTVTTEQKIIPVVSHNDSNNDGLCDDCDFDATKNCSHTCHSDNAFIQFFWKIINFLQKLFGVKSARYCDCGVDHW